MTPTELRKVIEMLGPDYVYAEDHDTKSCDKDDCLICGVIDCPHNEPLHYDKDGCPACEGPGAA